jgi:hypothetical protein
MRRSAQPKNECQPRDVVSVHRDGAGNGLFQTMRERRLAARTTPVERDDRRTTQRRANGIDQELGDLRQAFDSPRTRSRLTLAQDHRHSNIVARKDGAAHGLNPARHPRAEPALVCRRVLEERGVHLVDRALSPPRQDRRIVPAGEL